MKTIFDKSQLKVVPELQDEIIARFNSYDLLIRVMKLTAGNLEDMAKSGKITDTDKQDLKYLANRLKSATTQEWQKENPLYY